MNCLPPGGESTKDSIWQTPSRQTQRKQRVGDLEQERGRVVDVVYPDFSKAFNTVSHNILIGKLRKCGLEEWSVR